MLIVKSVTAVRESVMDDHSHAHPQRLPVMKRSKSLAMNLDDKDEKEYVPPILTNSGDTHTTTIITQHAKNSCWARWRCLCRSSKAGPAQEDEAVLDEPYRDEEAQGEGQGQRRRSGAFDSEVVVAFDRDGVGLHVRLRLAARRQDVRAVPRRLFAAFSPVASSASRTTRTRPSPRISAST